ncbi:MAG: xylulokinase [Notoacmeibacter sp.]|nr:xylulokinase [Notoacmeibacter sp.]
MSFLGIDLGTSGLKALLADGGGRVIGSFTVPLQASHPQDGWSEQDPASWIAACEAALDGLAREHKAALAAVGAIGLSGQMHGATLLDAADAVLRPAILWNDTRSHAEAARLDADPHFRQITGNIVFPGFTAPKLVWAARHEPAIFKRTRTVLLPKDYLRFWLTGEKVSDMSDAAGTSWFDTGARDWSDALLDATCLTRAHMPRLVEGSARSGTLRAPLASRWGMAPGVMVAGGAGDNAASAIGAGIVAPGAGFVSLGTSGVLFASCAGYSPKPESAVHTFCHAVPDTWHQMGVILSAASALEWFAGITGRSALELTSELGWALRPPGAALFHPYLSGERTPHNDAGLRAAFHNLSIATDRPAMTQSVLEGVAFAMRENRDALASAGTSLASVLALGGGSRSDYWLSLIASVLGIPVERPAGGDFGAAFGAARLAMLAHEGGNPVHLCTRPAVAQVFEPAPAMTARFDDAFARWQARRSGA